MSRKRKLQIGLAGFIVALCAAWLVAERYPNRQIQASQHFGERGAAVGFRFDAPQWIEQLLSRFRFGVYILYRTGSVASILLKDVTLTDADLLHLDNCSELEILGLENCRVSDDLIRRLPSFKNLSELSLSGVSDADLATIGQLKGLTRLSVEGAGITDAGVARLRELQGLESLSLMHTQVSDASIPQLCELAKLQRLYLQHTQVTEEGAAGLRTKLPNTKVYR